jgi:hypothetical protein
MESKVVSEAALFFLCLLSEVEFLGGFPTNVEVRVAWDEMRRADDMGETLVRVRYGQLLKL